MSGDWSHCVRVVIGQCVRVVVDRMCVGGQGVRVVIGHCKSGDWSQCVRVVIGQCVRVVVDRVCENDDWIRCVRMVVDRVCVVGRMCDGSKDDGGIT